jgi:putative PIN family toxin of toxin-antitoxin system
VLRVVLDVNVLVSAVIRQSSIPGQVLNAWRVGLFELVVSARLLAELRDVLGRSHLASYVTAADVDELLAVLEESAIVVDDPPLTERLVPADPEDDYLVALAREGRAQAIVTGDAHLLEAGLQPPALSPQDFLARLEQLPL